MVLRFLRFDQPDQNINQISSGQIEIFQQISDQIDMRPAQRVESQAAVPLLETYSSCLGITIVDSYLYVFYSNTIRVYQHFSQKFLPELSQELIVSQRKILRFAVNSHFIAMLYEDSKIQIRSREYWQRVQYSFNLAQEATKIGKFSLIDNMVAYQYFDEQEKCDIYGFVTLNENIKESPQTQTLSWTCPFKFDQITNLKELGNIENFYFGLIQNQIKFGTYYKIDNTQKLESFEFGSMKEENRLNKVIFFSILSLPNNTTGIKDEYCPTLGNNLYIIKLIDENNSSGKNKLVLKYRKFYEHVPTQKQEMDSEEKRAEAYTKMMNTLLQINGSKLEAQNEGGSEKILDCSGFSQKSDQISNNKKKKLSKSIVIDLKKDEKFSNFVEKKDLLYFSTNQRVFKFMITQGNGETNGKIQQIYCLEKDSRFIEACQNNIYITVPKICVTSYGNPLGMIKKIDPAVQKQKQKQATKQVQIQTEILSDILLDQIQQKELSKMIDNLLEKKEMVDVQSQTQPQTIQIQNKDQKENPKIQDEPKQKNKSYNEISIGGAFPMCPNSHEETLQKINNNLLQIQSSIHQDAIKRMQQFIKKEQEKTKQSVEKKIKQIVGAAISNSVIPAIEVHIRQVFEAKLQEVNLYLYSLTMENLLHLKQEIQKDEAKENMLRMELIKRQLYQVSESKKAVAQMVEICKKREIQKIVFFEEVKKKFVQIEKKVQMLEDKVKFMIQGEQMNEAKIFDQIEIIKTMLKCQDQKNQPIRKKSTVSQGKEQKNQAEDIKSDKQSQKQESEGQENGSEVDQSQKASSIEDSEVEFSNKAIFSTRQHGIPIANSRPYPFQYQYSRYPQPYPPNFSHISHYQPPMPPQYMPYPPPQGYGYQMGPRPHKNFSVGRVPPMLEFAGRPKNPPHEKQEQKKKHRKKQK